MRTGAIPVRPSPFSNTAFQSQAEASPSTSANTLEKLSAADSGSLERACYQAAHDGLKALKPKYIEGMPPRAKVIFKGTIAGVSAIKGFKKGYTEETPPNASGLGEPPALERLTLSGTPRSSSSSSLTALLRHSSSSTSLNGAERSASLQRSGSISGSLQRSGSTQDLVRSSSSSSLNLPHVSSSGSVSGMQRSASGTSLRHSASGATLARAALHVVEEADDAEPQPAAHYGKQPRKSIERSGRHPYGSPQRLRRGVDTLIAPHHTATLRAPGKPANYRMQVSFGLNQAPTASFGTRLQVHPEAPTEVAHDVRRMPGTVSAAPDAEITLHNGSKGYVVAKWDDAV